ncbi:MAG TPA: hypothetical protein VMU71_01515 [Terracidiphilus sp.]|nr:hypothetical protein [Terracidiphilus sp.]
MRLGQKGILGLAALTAAAFVIHGYHPFSEDAETYLPGIEKVLHPHLFPIGSEYFQLHADLTLFPQLIAGTVRLLHVSLPWAIFLWQVASFFLFLLACWKLMAYVFANRRACWAGVALVTALFTIPVAGTALYLMDPFLNPRNIMAFAQVFAVLRVMERKYLQAAVFLVFAASVHPLMGVFAASFCVVMVVMDRWPARQRSWERDEAVAAGAQRQDMAVPAALFFQPIGGLLDAPDHAYDKVMLSHRYQLLTRWTWYELLGAVAPLFIFWGFAAIGRARKMRSFELLSRGMAIYGVIYLAVGLVVSIPRRLEVLALLQPMRALELMYVMMLLFGGGLLGEYVLRDKAWRWAALFLPLAGGMAYAQRQLFPASQHIELPGVQPRNPWAQAFVWVRENTPTDAIFALDPYYMSIPGEDENGFRAIARRSQLADGLKDGGVVEMFPYIGDSWYAQVKAQTGIDGFKRADLERLRHEFGASWVILRERDPAELNCPYRNDAVMVCQIP